MQEQEDDQNRQQGAKLERRDNVVDIVYDVGGEVDDWYELDVVRENLLQIFDLGLDPVGGFNRIAVGCLLYDQCYSALGIDK